VKNEEAKVLIRDGIAVTAPYHFESYGPGRAIYSLGAAQEGLAYGPDGYLRVGLSTAGELIVDEWDDEVCPPALHGVRYNAEKGIRIVVELDELTQC